MALRFDGLIMVDYQFSDDAIGKMNRILSNELPDCELAVSQAQNTVAGCHFASPSVRAADSALSEFNRKLRRLKNGMQTYTDRVQEWDHSFAGALQGVLVGYQAKEDENGNLIPNDFAFLVQTLEKDQENQVLDKLEEDYENGLIDQDTYNRLRSGILSAGMAFIRESLLTKVTDAAAKHAANAIVTWLQQNTTLFLDRGLVAVTTAGTTHVMREAPNLLTAAIRGSVKYGVPIIGGLIDFGLMRARGEAPVDAAVKATAHVAIGIGAAKVGATIGTFFGGPIGTAAGAAVGFFVGVAGSMIFDAIYDNRDAIIATASEIIADVGNAINNVGNAVAGFFSGVANIFG